jgi:hypothetical protein
MASAIASPKIWIFNGDPGDELHHEKYQKMLGDFTKSFSSIYRIPSDDLKIFYGPREAGYEGICNKETLIAELKKAAAATHDASCSSVWIIFQGHSNSIPGGALFNIPGPDISPREIAAALKDAAVEKPLVVFATTTASEPFLRPIAAPGRIVITANSAGDTETETDYPIALAAALGDRKTDANNDGVVSVTEIFTACHSRIESMYNNQNFIIREHSQMDGNGDGRATRRPAAIDAEPGLKVGLRIGGNNDSTGKPGTDFD